MNLLDTAKQGKDLWKNRRAMTWISFMYILASPFIATKLPNTTVVTETFSFVIMILAGILAAYFGLASVDDYLEKKLSNKNEH
jgi:hypothetical protein